MDISLPFSHSVRHTADDVIKTDGEAAAIAIATSTKIHNISHFYPKRINAYDTQQCARQQQHKMMLDMKSGREFV